MKDEDRVLLQAEVLTKTSAPDFGSPYEKLVEIVEIVDFMVDNGMTCGDFVSTEIYRSLTDAEAAAFFVYSSLETAGMDQVVPQQVLGQLASAAATILIIRGDFTRKAATVMTPEEMVVNMAEATARLNAPGYGNPVAKVRELATYASENQIPLGTIMETQAYVDLTDAEAGAFLVFAILDRMGIASVLGGQSSANVAAAIIGTLIVHGGFERPGKG